MFPGQGAQRAGMLHRLPAHMEVEHTLEETRDALGGDPLQLDTAEAFASSFAVQICLLVAGVAMARVLMARGVRPYMLAGLSIGAYPAAVTAGALDYADAVHLVAKRGRLMDEAYPSGHGMAAIVGLEQARLEALIRQVHSAAAPVYLANLNAKRQFVIAGADEALAAVMRLATEQGANRVERLAVAVPSHCELLEDAAASMRAAIGNVKLCRPQLVYLSSSSARALSDPALIADDLAHNMARRVHWEETTRLAWERGARVSVEMPPGCVLTRLAAPDFGDGASICCDGNNIETVLATVGRESGG